MCPNRHFNPIGLNMMLNPVFNKQLKPRPQRALSFTELSRCGTNIVSGGVCSRVVSHIGEHST